MASDFENCDGAGGGASPELTAKDAQSFLVQVKDAFNDGGEKYRSFIQVMKDFNAKRTDTEGVLARVKELFTGHKDLILGFNSFLPEGYEITHDEQEITPTVEFEEAIIFVTKIKKRFEKDESIYKSFLHILNMYRSENKHIVEVFKEVTVLFEGHQDLLEDFTRFLPGVARASAQFGSNSLLQRRRDGNIAFHADRDVSVDRPFLKSMFIQGFVFCEKLKEKLCSHDDYQAFFKCLHNYSNGIIKRNDFQNLVTELLGKYPDLMEEFNNFLERCENIDGFLAGVMSRRMKRVRDDVCVGSQLKRPSGSSRVDSQSQVPEGEGASQNLPTNDAGTYLKEAKGMLQDKSEDGNETLSKETVEFEQAISNLMNRTKDKVECSICLERLGVNAAFIQLDCTHRFHARCFRRWWSKTHPTCPYCRMMVNEDGERVSKFEDGKKLILRSRTQGPSWHLENNADNMDWERFFSFFSENSDRFWMV